MKLSDIVFQIRGTSPVLYWPVLPDHWRWPSQNSWGVTLRWAQSMVEHWIWLEARRHQIRSLLRVQPRCRWP